MRAKSERISFSQNPILRSASLTGSIHEMTDDVRRISLDRRLSLEQANLEEDLDQGCLSSSALNLFFFFFPFCVNPHKLELRPISHLLSQLTPTIIDAKTDSAS